MGTLGILIALLSTLITIIIGHPKLSGVSLGYSVELSIFSVLIFIFLLILSCMSSDIYEATNKLAKDYNLEKFLDAISYEKNKLRECVDKIIKKLSM